MQSEKTSGTSAGFGYQASSSLHLFSKFRLGLAKFASDKQAGGLSPRLDTSLKPNMKMKKWSYQDTKIQIN